jgi:hypothetical protein
MTTPQDPIALVLHSLAQGHTPNPVSQLRNDIAALMHTLTVEQHIHLAVLSHAIELLQTFLGDLLGHLHAKALITADSSAADVLRYAKHMLVNPLGTIINNTQLCLQYPQDYGGDFDDAQLQALGRIQQAARAIVQTLLGL